MIVLYIFSGILALLAVILFLPLQIYLHYEKDSGFAFRLRFAWIPLFDSKKEKKPKEKKEEPQEKPKKEKKDKKEKKGSSALTPLLNFLGLHDVASIANAKKALDKKGLSQMLADLGTAVAQLFGRIGKLSLMPKDSTLKLFRELDIVCGRVNHFRDVLDDEQAWANDYIQKYRCQNGEERILPTCPVRLGSHGAFALGKPVMYGENNEEILETLGYTGEEIAKLKENGTIG